MSLLGDWSRDLVFPVMETVLGRRNVVRLARSMTMAVRRDVPNQMESNGELLVQQTVLHHLNDGPSVIFDVGANAGEWSLRLLSAGRDKAISLHAFEPASATFQRLQENLKPAASRVRLVHQALSSAKGTGSFFIAGEGLGINSLHPRTGETSQQETVELNTVTDYCRENGIAHIHLMKIDAEGHDLKVIEGAQGMLDTKSIDIIQFEYNQRWIDSHCFLKDVFNLLQPRGYHIGKVTPHGIEFYPAYHFELESFREANYLACLPEWEAKFPQVKWWNME